MKDNIEQAFIKRAIELTQEIQKSKTNDDMRTKAHELEGYLTGALEIFSMLNSLAPQK